MGIDPNRELKSTAGRGLRFGSRDTASCHLKPTGSAAVAWLIILICPIVGATPSPADLAISNVRVITGTGEVLSEAEVVVSRGRIVSVGRKQGETTPMSISCSVAPLPTRRAWRITSGKSCRVRCFPYSGKGRFL